MVSRTASNPSRRTPLIGDCSVGAVAFSVEPSALASAATWFEALGDEGVVAFLLQAATTDSVQASAAPNLTTRVMKYSPDTPRKNQEKELGCGGNDTQQLSRCEEVISLTAELVAGKRHARVLLFIGRAARS